MHAAAITFAELTWDLSWTTKDGRDRTPVIPSHEMSGTVARLAPDADRALLQALRAGDPVAVGLALHNDLQVAALELAPGLAETLAVAQDAGALGVIVSGSGPTVAALARSRQHAMMIAAALTAADVADSVVTAVGSVPGARVLVSSPLD